MKEVSKTFLSDVKVSALIPAKGFANAKQRLAPLLDAKQRALLAEAMLKDVLCQVLLARGLETIFVVTGDAGVAGLASSMGVELILESEERGETAAVEFARREMTRRGCRTALVIPADIPLVHASDIEGILGHPAAKSPVSPFALLVPSHDRMGTNGLLLSPPDLMPLRFGYDSFSYHLSQVAARGVTPVIVENGRLGLDIDEPKDLERLLSLGAVGETNATLASIGMVPERL
jgi:2-phospho-L-lactate guanylyltransferase